MSNWLTCQAQRLVVKGVTSNWHQVTVGFHSLILGPGLLINYLDAELKEY